LNYLRLFRQRLANVCKKLRCLDINAVNSRLNAERTLNKISRNRRAQELAEVLNALACRFCRTARLRNSVLEREDALDGRLGSLRLAIEVFEALPYLPNFFIGRLGKAL
jgi:hypothetical protein